MSSSVNQSSYLRYGRYIGRVGALAVSLGVGFAVAAPGVAYAEEPGDSPSASDTESTTNDTTDGATTPVASSAPETGDSVGPRQLRRAERPGLSRIFGVNPATPQRRERPGRPSASGRVDDQTNTVVNDAESGDTVAVADKETARVLATRKPANDIGRQLVSRPVKLDQRVTRPAVQAADPMAAVVPNAGVDVTAVKKASVRPAITAITSLVVNRSPSTRVTRTAVNPPAPVVAAVTPTPAPSTPTTRPVALVSGFLAAVGLTPTLTPPTTPAPAPATFVWAVLAFVRREIEQVQRTYFNRTPDAVNDAVSTPEQTSVTFNPVANDRDDDALEITGMDASGVTHGTVTRTGNTITYTPNAATNSLGAGESVTDTISYTVSDAGSPAHLHGFLGLFSRGHTDTATVTITVTGVNDAPTVVDDPYLVPTNTTLTGNVRDNDSDVDGDSLAFAVVGAGPSKGSLNFNPNGSFTYTPEANFSGVDRFTYEASDGSLKSTGTVTITVNSPPTVGLTAGEADPVTGAVSVVFSWRDAASDTITVTPPATLGNFVLVGSGGDGGVDPVTDEKYASNTYLYVAKPEARLAAYNRTGPLSESVSVAVSDGLTTVTKTVDVPISPSRTPITGVAVGSPDADGDGAVTIDIDYIQNASAPSPAVTTSGAQHGTLEQTASGVTVPAPGATVKQGSIRYTYVPKPEARTAAYNNTGPESETVTFTVDGQTFEATVPISPAEAVVTGTVGGTSGPGLLNPIDVGVSPGGDRGIIVDRDGGLVIIERGGDGDDDWDVGAGLDVDLGDTRGGVAVDVDRGYIGGADQSGGGRLTVVDLDTRQVREVEGLQERGIGAVTDVALDRRAANGRAQVIYAADAAGNLVEVDRESGRVLRTLPTRDLEARSIEAAAAVAPTRSVLAVAPGAGKVYVGTGGRITAVKTRQVATARSAVASDEMAVDRAIDVDGEVTDLEVSADGRTLLATVVRADTRRAELVEYDAVTLERRRSVSIGEDARSLAISDDGNRAYISDSRAVRVVDLRELAVTQRIDTGAATGVAFVPGRDTVLVTNPDRNSVSVVSNPFTAPTVATDDSARTGEDNSVVIDVLANDTDTGGAALAPTIVSGPSNGTVTLVNGRYVYTPNVNFRGTDTFSYTVTGGTSNAAPAKVNITVTQAINVTLSWGSLPDGTDIPTAPDDLDAHLLGPAAANGSGPLHVFYSDRTYEVTTQGLVEAGAFLNIDDTDGDGPEIIEINTRTPGDYVYYVDNFSDDGGLSTSGASVTVVDPVSGLERTYSVPSGSGRYWSVFKMTVANDGTVTITPLNRVSNTAPTLEDSVPSAL